MDFCLSYATPRFPTLPAGVIRRPVTFGLRVDGRPLIVVASTSSTSKREFGGLNAPLEPRTPAGRFLSGVLLDDRDNFRVAARKELERLANERDEAAARLQLSLGSDEACLHRRIAEFKKHECRDAVEEVMYMLIFHKFNEMRVHLIPRLSKCVYNGRLEIWPSKDWELESIHSFEVLQMVREHLSAVVGWKSISNVTASWATTEIQRFRLCKLYAASILYGYFLKSASLRHHLERGLDLNNSHFGIGARNQLSVPEMFSVGSDYITSGRVGSTKSSSVGQVSYSLGSKQENLRFYVMGFDAETIQMCAKLKSKEAVNLIERHSCALFGDEETGLVETDDVITTSFASLKRFLLEAVAFGSFLWEAENCVNAVYMLEEN
ncbi:UV-B-induced protein, chloroplastic [Sesamum alatum]|uniref:UV-B-induced protein, chloroplastic n=1 Tax=Sesamum alatum TaxID=300844 RepID=A0AAE2CZS4_9LAMI|nr:UV-B-induced protein, chloroplastic [Sesamum alatum]